MSKKYLYHVRVLTPLSIFLVGANLIYGLLRLPDPIVFSIGLIFWWRQGLMRIFPGLPGAPSMTLAIKGLAMALFWPIMHVADKK